MKDKEKEIKYQIYLIDQEIKGLKKQKRIYVDELKQYENKKVKGNYERRKQNTKR